MGAEDCTCEALEKIQCGSKKELRRIEQERMRCAGATKGVELGAGGAGKLKPVLDA